MDMPGQKPMPQGAPAPQAPQRPQPQAPQGAQPQDGGRKLGAQEYILMIHHGYQGLGEVLSSAPPGALDPEDKKLFNDGVNTFQALVGRLGQPQGQPGQTPQPSGGASTPMMPQHANSGAKAAY